MNSNPGLQELKKKLDRILLVFLDQPTDENQKAFNSLASLYRDQWISGEGWSQKQHSNYEERSKLANAIEEVQKLKKERIADLRNPLDAANSFNKAGLIISEIGRWLEKRDPNNEKSAGQKMNILRLQNFLKTGLSNVILFV